MFKNGSGFIATIVTLFTGALVAQYYGVILGILAGIGALFTTVMIADLDDETS